jgi:hypothetical protein
MCSRSLNTVGLILIMFNFVCHRFLHIWQTILNFINISALEVVRYLRA